MSARSLAISGFAAWRDAGEDPRCIAQRGETGAQVVGSNRTMPATLGPEPESEGWETPSMT
ncbi:hypothetical protein FHT78_000488 [Rhizobium sp. BK196]|nr:hypothetical protein [Rhizobium sp. BK196]